MLASSGTGFNVSSVEALIQRGDAAVASGNLVQAKKDYDNARTASKQLLAFYRDLSGSFRGLDARIPREMDTKGRAALALLAQSNLRLAALFRRQGQPEVAVPVLVEVVRLQPGLAQQLLADPDGGRALQDEGWTERAEPEPRVLWCPFPGEYGHQDHGMNLRGRGRTPKAAWKPSERCRSPSSPEPDCRMPLLHHRAVSRPRRTKH